MFSKISSSLKIIILLFFLAALGYLAYTNADNLLASTEGIKGLLQKTGVGAGSQDVSLPKVDKIRGADEKTNHILYKFIEILITLAGIIALIFVIIGGMEYTVSAGSSDRQNGAKHKIMYALLGLLAVIFSYAIFTNGINFFEVAGQ